ncbi:MAG: aminotransferase class V-fold PLP-dependent enzyme, partial [Sinomicrobium sp.]|nr:aminotransferase class V-fold PLP-dependent enzyme [Sinomicrobium sp.]
ASPAEIVFTSGGTEADNMILRGAVRDLGVETIITSRIEHYAVLHTALQLQKEYNINVKYVTLGNCGLPDLDHLEHLLQADTSRKLVTLMHVNNEIGNMTDVDAVAKLCRQYDALFHSDAVQSVGHWEWDVQKTEVDFLAASAHKFHGPKGTGFAYIRKNSGLKPLIFGGEQERGFRAGTEAFHNIVGLETALKLAYDNLDEERRHISGLKRYFIETIKDAFPEATFNGGCEAADKSTYTLVNVCLPVDEEKAQILLFHLDINGIACSRGSACQSGSSKGSHVLNTILR